MAYNDHGTVTGSVSVDASTDRVHRFNLEDDDTVIEEPSGCSDGDTVMLIFTATGNSSHIATWDFYAAADIPNPRYGAPVKVLLTKLGSKWFA